MIKEYLENITDDEILELVESLGSCGGGIRPSAALEDLKMALKSNALEKHATNLVSCKKELEALILKKSKPKPKPKDNCNCPC